jgi:hypothetical protein
MVTFDVVAAFTRGDSSWRWRAFSTSGQIGATALLEVPAEEDSLQVNIHVIKQ